MRAMRGLRFVAPERLRSSAAAGRAGLLTLLLLLPASLRAQAPTPPEAPDRLFALDRAGRAIADARCPRPAEALTRYLSDPLHPGQRDEMTSIDCRQFRIALLARGAGAAAQPISLVVTGPHPLLLPPLEVGSSDSAVRAILGEPDQRFGANLSYRLSAERDRDRVTFEIERGRVRAVSFAWAPP